MSVISERFDVGGAPDGGLRLSSQQRDLIQIVADFIKTRRYGLTSFPCPCGAECGDETIARVERYSLPMESVICRGCGTIRFDPYLDESSVADFYTRYYQQMYGRVGKPNEYFERQIIYGHRILDAVRVHLPPDARIFEVGCGAGGSLKVFQDANYEVSGCEYSQELVKYGLAQNLHDLVVGSIDQLAEQVQEKKADLLFLHHVFEHLTDPAAFLVRARSLLSSTGRILIVIPDISRIDAYPYPGGNLLPFLHISHKTNFTATGLEALGKRLGFDVRVLTDIPMAAPELWVEFLPSDHPNPTISLTAGVAMLRYLRWTEKLYQLGLCRGQIIGYRMRLKRLAKNIPTRAAAMIRRVLPPFRKG